MKQANVPAARKGELGVGDVWTWTAIDAAVVARLRS